MRQPAFPRRASTRHAERGGFLLGLVVGLLVGLALALGVALYVTKVPVPFLNKVPQRSAEQDAAQAEKNRNWDPNAPLAGKNVPRASAIASGAAADLPPAAAQASVVPASATRSSKAAETTRKDGKDVASASPDPFTYFVQAGAYARSEDAEQQRASLALLGFASKVTEREQSGRTVYRVRVGPYESKDEADAAKARLDGAGIDSALVRVQR